MIETIAMVINGALAAAFVLRRRPKWIAYDPAWLVDASERQYPDQPQLVAALARCTRACRESRAYIHFVAPERPNQPGSEWQFERNLLLEKTAHGTLVLDILRDGRVGGVEFLSRLR